MAKAGRTFSESWHRVAGLKVCLHPTVSARKQAFRGETWYILRDPFNNQFFRLRPEAYDFVIRLRTDRTVEEVWHDCLERNPDEAPGQEDVIQLLTQLHFGNLLYFEQAADSAKLYKRFRKRKQKELRAKLLSIMFFRMPLLDPERMLKKAEPFIRAVFSPVGAVVWFIVVALAIKVVVDRFDMAMDQFQGVLAPNNLFLLYVGLVIIKTLHEFGHAAMCRRFGGEVHTMGVMLLVFTPLPYMDATSSWAFRSRWQRALVGAAGMITEVFIAGLAAFVWARTGPGTAHSLAYNIMFIASVSTLIFNGNPLLRFDGYYILSDLLDIPNLHTRSKKHLRHLVEYYAFGYRESFSPARSPNEAVWLTVFGIASGIYRVIVFTGIVLFIADKFLLAGLLMALVCVISWVIVPLYKFVVYLATSPRLSRTRTRAVALSIGCFVVIVGSLAVLPFPNRFRAPGVLEAVNYTRVINNAPGHVSQLLADPGDSLAEGVSLMVLTNRELELEIAATVAQREETLAMRLKAMRESPADLEPIRKRLEAVESKLQDLLMEQASLAVRARLGGIWVAPQANEMVGSWLHRGALIGELVDPEAFRFSAVVSQDEAADLFEGDIRRPEVRIFGQGGENLDVNKVRIIPFQQETLPSAALGWFGGGSVAVSSQDDSGLKTAEPFFQIYADIVPNPAVKMHHGQSGKVRFTLKPRPLLIQWGHKLRQLLQRRYQI